MRLSWSSHLLFKLCKICSFTQTMQRMKTSYTPMSLPNTHSLFLSLPSPALISLPSQNPCFSSVATSSSSSSSLGRLPLIFEKVCRQNISTLQCTATQEIVETDRRESAFVEIGYISSVHGLQGEVRVKSSTDFPELRFSKPGRRWLRQQISGREAIREVTLVDGRGHPGHKRWIVRFGGVDTVDQAQQLVGSTLLVTGDDRPKLKEGEFYSHDLVGMTVILKDTGQSVGTVVNVFNSGANDILQVMLNTSVKAPDGTGLSKSELGASGPLVWVPFVESIVPNVDMTKREMLITPPNGLLELNIRTDERSKKERRQLEWKERKKYQRRLIAAKKKLHEMGQQHIFDGLRFGDKAERDLLADQIIAVNSRLLQHALQNIEMPSKRWDASDFLRANLCKQMRVLNVSEECFVSGSHEMQEKGLHLTSEGKAALVLVLNDNKKVANGLSLNLVSSEETAETSRLLLKALLSDNPASVKIEDRGIVPLVVVCPAHDIGSIQELFSLHDHFAFDREKVWFLEEEKLPVISSLHDERCKHKILMKSPWEVLQRPVGSGGVISLLSSHNIIKNLGEMGVEYIEVCSVSQKHVGGQALIGLVNSSQANVGIQLLQEMENYEDNLHMVFSVNFMQQLTNQICKLQFHSVLKENSHVEMADKKWVDIIPSSPNSFELSSSIYSTITICLPNKVCVMEVI